MNQHLKWMSNFDSFRQVSWLPSDLPVCCLFLLWIELNWGTEIKDQNERALSVSSEKKGPMKKTRNPHTYKYNLLLWYALRAITKHIICLMFFLNGFVQNSFQFDFFYLIAIQNRRAHRKNEEKEKKKFRAIFTDVFNKFRFTIWKTHLTFRSYFLPSIIGIVTNHFVTHSLSVTLREVDT